MPTNAGTSEGVLFPDDPTGFDLGFTVSGHPEIGQSLEVGKAIVSGASGAIRAHVTNEVANAAVTADTLTGKLVGPIQQSLGNAAQTLLGLHQPIATQIAGDLGQAVEPALRLGVVPPVPGQPGAMPANVLIRKGALAGDLGPALEAYRLTAGPYHGFGGMAYAQAMQGITNALPADPAIQANFAAAVQQINRNPASGVPMTPNAGDCTSQVAMMGQTALAACAANNPLGGQSYADCATSVNNMIQQSLAGCSAPGVPGAPPIGGTWGPGGTTPNAPGPVVPTGPGGPAKPDCPPGIAGHNADHVPGCPFMWGLPGIDGGPPTPGVPVQGDWPGAPILYPPPAGTILVPDPNHPGYYGYYSPGGGFVQFPVPGDPDHPITPMPQPGQPSGAVPGMPGGTMPGQGPIFSVPPITPPTPPTMPPAGSPPTTGSPDPCNAESIRAIAQPVWDGSLDITNTAQTVQAMTGFPTYATGASVLCDTGYMPVSVQGMEVSGASYQLCVKCSPAKPPVVTTDSKCCPVNVTVNCPPATSTTPPASAQPPKLPPGPPLPIPPAAGVVNQDIAGCKDFGAIPGVNAPGGLNDISKLIGLRKDDGSLNTDWVAPTGIIAIDNVLKSLVQLWITPLDQTFATLSAVLNGSGCANGQQISLIATAVLARFAEKFVGDALKIITEPNRQQREFLCPTDLPSLDESAQAWLGNTIDEKTLECWTRAAGSKYPERKTYIDSIRAKFPLLQIGSLYLRGKLTAKELDDRVRELGMTKGTEVDDLKELLKVIPPPTDLVRFMVRDADDNALAARIGMDDDFQAKFGKQIKEWAEASGVSEEYMAKVWRAHWSIPSPGQLYEMLHRKVKVGTGNPQEITIADVEAALKQQDILPYWVNGLLEVSYNPLTRIDAKRAYQIGTLSRDALKRSYTDLGYNDANAEVLVEFNVRQTLLTFLRNPLVGQFSKGTLSDSQFDSAMSQQGADQGTIDAARQQATLLASQSRRKACVNALHRRYMLGEMSQTDAMQQLISLEVPANISNEMVAGWACELYSRGKAISASDLATLYSQGAIDASELVRRLQMVGYGYNDAVLLGRKIATINQQRMTTAETKAIKSQEAEARRQHKEANAAVAKAGQQIEKANRGLQAMNKVKALREKRLIEAGGSLVKTLGMSLGDAVVYAKSLYTGYLSSSVYLPDEIVAAIITASKDAAITSKQQLQRQVDEILSTQIPVSPLGV